MFDIFGIGKILGLASSALNFATPFISGVVAFSKWYLAEMYDSLKTILRNPSTLVFIGTVIVVSVLYGINTAECSVGPIFPDNPTITDPSTPWRFDWNK